MKEARAPQNEKKFFFLFCFALKEIWEIVQHVKIQNVYAAYPLVKHCVSKKGERKRGRNIFVKLRMPVELRKECLAALTSGTEQSIYGFELNFPTAFPTKYERKDVIKFRDILLA